MTADLVQLPTPGQGYTREQIELVKRTVAKGATDDELALFLGTAQRMGLDPFANQIRAIRRKEYNDETKTYEHKLSIEPGIDGFRLIAARTTQLEGRLGPLWCGTDGHWVDAWLKDGPPAAAKVGVLRKGFREPLWAVALYREYVATKRDGEPTKMWRERPAGQLAKCAEALALRTAFPHELGGVYTAEEMAQAGPPNTTVVQADELTAVDGEPFEDGLPKRWAVDNVRDPEDARWLLQQPEISDDYRERVKTVIAATGLHWPAFWRTGNAVEWRNALGQALDQMSGEGEGRRGPRVAPPDPTSGARRQGPSDEGTTFDAHDRAPDPTRSASTPEPEAANRSGVEATNPKDASAGAGGPPTSGATPPPDPRSPGGSGGTKGARPAGGPGKADPDQAEQAAFDQRLAGDDR